VNKKNQTYTNSQILEVKLKKLFSINRKTDIQSYFQITIILAGNPLQEKWKPEDSGKAFQKYEIKQNN
jgi:hypothetical protein